MSMEKRAATHLRVQLDRDGETCLALRLPATAVADLADLVPLDLRERSPFNDEELEERGRDFMQRGYPVGDVLRLSSATMVLRIWLE